MFSMSHNDMFMCVSGESICCTERGTSHSYLCSIVRVTATCTCTYMCCISSLLQPVPVLISFVAAARVVIAVAVDAVGDLPLIALRCRFLFFAGCTALCCLYSFRAIAGIFVKTIDTKRTGC